MAASTGTRVVLLTAGAQLLAGLAGVMVGDPATGRMAKWLAVTLALWFATSAVVLLAGGRSDRRAVYLGTTFLIIGASFCPRFPADLAAALPPLVGVPLRLLVSVQSDTLLPLYLGLFARSFPERRRGPRGARAIDVGLVIVGVLGGILLVSRLWPIAGHGGLLAALGRIEGEGAHLILCPLVLVPALVGARAASLIERRRSRVFLAALILGIGPIALEILMEALLPEYREFVRRRDIRPVYQLTLYPLLASVPFTTAYAVLVGKVLDVRLIARRALQYALARYSTLAMALVPFAALCAYLYRHRETTVASLFSGAQVTVLAAVTAAGVAALRYRHRVLDAVDRRFFRERYDARQLLTLLVDQVRGVPSHAALADLVAHGIDRALHLEGVALLAADPTTGLLADPLGKVRPLDPSSRLAQLIASSPEPLAADLEAPISALKRLPEEERYWLGDGRFQLLMPLVSTDGSLLGVLALGEKKSGLPFLKEDRQLLAAIAHSAALALELQLLRRHGREALAGAPGEAPADLPTSAPAMECGECGSLSLPGSPRCSACGRAVEPAGVPYILPGKFRFEARIGAGGMGIVYRAVDLALGRPVAVKTLRRLSPEDAVRLRREARTAAAVSHPNLAFVYGVETWRGTPMLILEYLEGGTLAERLARGSLSADETVELGIAMAGALERLHGADILHRDIKPTNIGYTRDDTPKLMDFGIARTSFDPRPEGGSPAALAGDLASLHPTLLWSLDEAGEGSSRRLIGTLFYVPPEALGGAPPDPTFDLWSLCLVLYECVAGVRVFSGSDVKAILRAIRSAGIPDIRHYRPDCPSVLSDFFARGLNRNPELRLASAAELRRQLEEVQRKLAA